MAILTILVAAASRSRVFVAVATYAVSFVTVAAVAFVLVMAIAGPHSGVLEPGLYSQMTVLAGVFMILIVPIVAAYAALRRRTP